MAFALKTRSISSLNTKSGVPNFDPIFSSGYPYAWFDGANPYAAMRNRPGINHAWIYATISTIIQQYVQCPLRLYDKTDPKKTLIDSHPILTLLKNPNPDMSGTNFLEAIMWALMLPTRGGPGGTCFIWGDDRSNFRKGQIPDELWLQADASVKPKLNAQKVLEGWIFDYQEGISPYDYGKDMTLDLQEVLRINFFNPYNTKSGASPGNALRAGINQDADAGLHNSSLINNGATTKGVYTAKKAFTPQQLADFKAQIEKYQSGAANAGKSLFIPWEMDYTPNSLSNEDMQYYEQLGWNREAVIAVYKVSKFCLGLYEDLNYATAKEAKRQLFEQAIIPVNSMIMQELNQMWLDYVGNGNLQLCVDMSAVKALNDDLDARWKRADLAVQWGVPPIAALTMNDIPVDDLKAYAWLKENQSAMSAFQSDPIPADPADKSKSVKKKDLTQAEKWSISDDYIAKVLTPGERSLLVSVRRFLVDQRNRNLDLVDEWAKAHPDANVSHGTAPASDFELPANKEDDRLRLMMKPHYERQAQTAHHTARVMIAEVKKAALTTDSTQTDIQEFILKRLKFISVVNSTTFAGVEKEVAASLADSIDSELSTKDTAKALKESVSQVYATRINEANNIARTETGTVSMFVQTTTMKNAGIERKRWLSARDEATRPDHLAADMEGVIEFSEVFDATEMHYPLESGAPAKQCCNCRCLIIPVGPEGSPDE